MAVVEFYFDYRSPYAYLAQTQLGGLAGDTTYRPFDIRKLMDQVGNVPTSVTCRPKNRYIQNDLRRWVEHYGVPFQRNPDILEVDAQRLLRATLWAVEKGSAPEVVTALFSAMWGRPQPLKTTSDVVAVLRQAGCDDADLEVEIDDPLRQAALERATTAAADLGVFGAPSIVVAGEMFFGNDRLDFVRAALARGA